MSSYTRHAPRIHLNTASNVREEARFLSMRIIANLYPTTPQLSPSELLQYPFIPKSFRLLRALYTRNYHAFHSTLSSTEWSPPLAVLVGRFLADFRLKTLRLLSYGYTTVTASRASTCLGIEMGPSLTKDLLDVGWSLDREKALFTTAVQVDGCESAVLANSDIMGSRVSRTDGRIARLTGLVTHLTEVP